MPALPPDLRLLALIDGLHIGPAPLNDFRMVDPKIVAGGVVLFHDATIGHYEGVANAVEEVGRSYPGYEHIEAVGSLAAFRKVGN